MSSDIVLITDWKHLSLSKDLTIQDAIRCLNDNATQIVLIADEFGHLLGTISDGDIRRALLKTLSLETRVEQIMSLNPVVANMSDSIDQASALMRQFRIRHIPIVDTNKRIAGVFADVLSANVDRRLNTFVIMAGGKGKRLHPHTETCPKPMLKLAGRPMLEHIILQAKMQGFIDFVLCVGHLHHVIENYFEDGARLGVKIRYIKEIEPLGTAGALSYFEPSNENPIVVSNGDIITGINYGELLEFHCTNKSHATMSVRLNEWENPFGVVHTDGYRIQSIEEKPIVKTYVNAGIYAFSKVSLTSLNVGEKLDMPQFFSRLKKNKLSLLAYPIYETWIDVGRPEDLQRAQWELSG